MAKTIHHTAPPFRGVDLLDQVYGIADHYPSVKKTCQCGKVTFLVDERVIPYCPACKPADPFEGAMVLEEDDFGPDEPVVRIPRKGNRDRWFQFFANSWWELDAQLHRTGEPVTAGNLIHKLDKFSKRIPVTKPLFSDRDKPFTYWSVTRTGRVVSRSVADLPPCDCMSEEFHEAYPSALAGICPQHGQECATCGEDHFSAD